LASRLRAGRRAQLGVLEDVGSRRPRGGSGAERWDERRVETVSTEVRDQKRESASKLPRYVLGQSHVREAGGRAQSRVVVGGAYLGQTRWRELIWKRETWKKGDTKQTTLKEEQKEKKPGVSCRNGKRRGGKALVESSSKQAEHQPAAAAKQQQQGAARSSSSVSGHTASRLGQKMETKQKRARPARRRRARETRATALEGRLTASSLSRCSRSRDEEEGREASKQWNGGSP
jgi:hypothetical protein